MSRVFTRVFNKGFQVLAGVGPNNIIGLNGGLPWNIRVDLQHFRRLTVRTGSLSKHHAVIMGYKTDMSLPFSPLPHRLNVVLKRGNSLNNEKSENHKDTNQASITRKERPKTILDLLGPTRMCFRVDLDQALDRCLKDPDVDQTFVIGGSTVYRTALAHPLCRKVILSRITYPHGLPRQLQGINNDWHVKVYFPHLLADRFRLIEKTQPTAVRCTMDPQSLPFLHTEIYESI